jgi:hypothetical protein
LDVQVIFRPGGMTMASPGYSRYDADLRELVGSQAEEDILLQTPVFRLTNKSKRRRNRRVEVEYQVTFEG